MNDNSRTFCCMTANTDKKKWQDAGILDDPFKQKQYTYILKTIS